jgi:hypothetical protein
MKRIFLIVLISFSVISCSLEDDGDSAIVLEVVPIESVDMPEVFEFGQVYQIDVTYIRPNGCYQFYDYFYDINDNERTIAVINRVYDDSSCSPDEDSVTVSFNFTVTSTETYVFRFYAGQNEDEEDEYHIIEVPVELPD